MRSGVKEIGHDGDHERLRDRLVEADRQRRVVVGQRRERGGHEVVARDARHRRQYPRVERRFAKLLARQLGVNGNHLHHMPPQDGEMLFRYLAHTVTSLDAICRGAPPIPGSGTATLSVATRWREPLTA